MKPEAQRIAIVEFCQWELLEDKDTGLWTARQEPEGNVRGMNAGLSYKHAQQVCLPDYLKDMNAIREAVMLLSCDSRKSLSRAAFQLVLKHIQQRKCLLACELTAADWCEALLRTINQWTDDEGGLKK